MTTWDKEFARELDARIRCLEEDPQTLPPRFSPRDYILTAGAILLCLAGVLLGAFL